MVEVLRHENGFFIEVAQALLKEHGIPTFVVGRSITGERLTLTPSTIVGCGGYASLLVPEDRLGESRDLVARLPLGPKLSPRYWPPWSERDSA